MLTTSQIGKGPNFVAGYIIILFPVQSQLPLKYKEIMHSKYLEVRNCPTGPFTALEPQDQEIGQIYVVQECCEKDFEAPKL